MELLTEAQVEWHEKSLGKFQLILTSSKSNQGDDMVDVHAQYVATNRTASLLSIAHRPISPYPARIYIRDGDVPSYLQKSYTVRTGVDFASISNSFANRTETVNNEWVADSPSEFRRLLSKALNLGGIKGIILNLASQT